MSYCAFKDLMSVAIYSPDEWLNNAWLLHTEELSAEEFEILNGDGFSYPPVNSRHETLGMTFDEQRMFMMFAYWAVRI